MQAHWLFIAAAVLILCELFVFSYFLLFIGLGVLITAVLTLFGVVNSPVIQLLCIVAFSLLAILTLRPLMKRFSRARDDFTENANLKLRLGTKAKVVAEGVIECKGTMWKSDTSGFKINERVKIIGFKDDTVIISKA